MILLLFLVLGALCSSASGENHTTPVCTESDYQQFYFEACLADAFCTHNLNLHHDEAEAFGYLLHTEILMHLHLEPDEICTAEAFPVVLALLRHYEFCKPNYILDIDQGCICRLDRNCDEKNPSHFRLSELSKTLLILVFLVLAVYIGMSMLKTLEKLSKPSTEEAPKVIKGQIDRRAPIMLDVT